MQCEYFGVCGGCDFYEPTYAQQLAHKVDEQQQQFGAIYDKAITAFGIEHAEHRARAEFRVWHEGQTWDYALTHLTDKKRRVLIKQCVKLLPPIQAVMATLRNLLVGDLLQRKLFSIEFLSTQTSGLIITLLYHKQLDDAWREAAIEVANTLGVHIIGRAKKQRIVLDSASVIEQLHIEQRTYRFLQFEGGFTQPNPAMNEKMISWAVKQANLLACDDLLELYCGIGNFTLPLAAYFKRVLATEISKTSIAALKSNCEENAIQNISVARLSADEAIDAIKRVRPFTRLRHVDLDDWHLTTLFVDPPRAGLSQNVVELAKSMKQVIYISCNPQTLLRDVTALLPTHRVASMALFDQFAYTHHSEMGVILIKRSV